MEQTASGEERSTKQVDRYASVADEIRGLSQDVTRSLLAVLLELAKSHPGSVYIAAKKHAEKHGFLLLDEGYVGVSDKFVVGENDEYLLCPGDVAIYVMTTRLKTGDVLVVFYYSKELVRFYHGVVSSFDPGGSVEVRDPCSGKLYWEPPERILGKLAKIVQFGSREWHELIGQLVSKKYLMDILINDSKRLEEGDLSDKLKRIAELKRRLTILAAGQP
ncbi:MAG: hypothetical protein JRN59_08465 [Nitrososphaerota archaeon]|nr:hypothetical protein [Nitrososphaerota archaeon]